MSLKAWSWVLEEAPDVPPHLVGTLAGLANHADKRGRGSYPSQELLAFYTRKSDRAVRKDLRQLEELALIRRGDQRLVAHLAADERPIVWDLAIERKRAEPRPGKDTRDRNHSSAPTAEGTGTVVPAQQAEGPEPQFRPEPQYRAEPQFQRGRNSSSEGTGTGVPTNRPGTVLEPLHPQSPAARIVAELGIEEDDATKVWNHIQTERRPNAPSRYLNALITGGDLRAIADRVLGTGDQAPAPSRVKGPTHVFESDPTDPVGVDCQHCPLPEDHPIHRHLRVAGQ